MGCADVSSSSYALRPIVCIPTAKFLSNLELTDTIPISTIGNLNPKSKTININTSTTISSPNLSPSNATEPLRWESSDTSVATVLPSEDSRSVTVMGIKMGTATITAYAEENEQISTSEITVVVPATVTYMVDGETYSTANTIVGGTIGTLPNNPSKTGRTFVGWYDATDEGNKYDSSSTVNGDITLYAKWSVTATFNSNGGSSINSQTIDYGTYLTKPNNPTREYYIFDGWYSNSSLTNEFNFDNVVNSNITLYAKWIETKFLGDATNKNKYGYKVSGYTSKNYSGIWRLFYQDENNTYIIADPTSTTYKPSSYSSSYSSGASVSTEGQNLNYRLKVNGGFVSTNKNTNIRATAWLTDTRSTSIWSSTYKDAGGIASYAIGSPTIELYVESYKATHPSSQAAITASSYEYTPKGMDSGLNTPDNYGIYGTKSWWLASPRRFNL